MFTARSRSASLVAAATRHARGGGRLRDCTLPSDAAVTPAQPWPPIRSARTLPSGAAVAPAQPWPPIRSLRTLPSGAAVAPAQPWRPIRSATLHAGGCGWLRAFSSSTSQGGTEEKPSTSPSPNQQGGTEQKPSMSPSPNQQGGTEEKLDRALQMLDKLTKDNARSHWTFRGPFIAVSLMFGIVLEKLYINKKAKENRERLKPAYYIKNQLHQLSRDDELREDLNFLVDKAADRFLEILNQRMNPLKWIWGSEKGIAIPIQSEWVGKVYMAASLIQGLSKKGINMKDVSIIHILMGYLKCDEKLANDILEVLVSIQFLKVSSDKKGNIQMFEMSKKYRNDELGANKEFMNKLVEAEKARKK